MAERQSTGLRATLRKLRKRLTRNLPALFTSISRRRRLSAWAALLVSLLLVVSLVMVLIARNLQANNHPLSSNRQNTPALTTSTATTQQNTPAATRTPQPSTLPVSSTWRVAYLASNGTIHAVSLDGKQDVAGPSLPGLASYGLDFANAGFAPNGYTLAYNTTALTILNLNACPMTSRTVNISAIYDIAWSHDGSQLALGDGVGGIWTVNTSSGAPVAIPNTQQKGIRDLIGWIDGAHLAVSVFPASASSTPSVALGSLDITSGRLQSIATISAAGLGTANFILSPDGSEALFYNTPFQNNPFTPLVEAITIATGQVTSLANIAATANVGFSSVAWRPGTQTLAASTGLDVSSQHVWLLNLQSDSATHLTSGQYVTDWTPDGSALVLATSRQAEIGEGPHDISAIPFPANSASSQFTMTPLTHAAATFPIIGFMQSTSTGLRAC